MNEFGVDGTDVDEVRGYGNDDEDDEGNQREEEPGDDCDGHHGARRCENYGGFQKRVRITGAKRAEGNRRAGGQKTQRVMGGIFLPSSEC